MLLPNEYQEVEWIENTGTTQEQYIDTGVTATANISTELVMTPNTSYTDGEYAIMGTNWTAQGIFLMFYNNVWRYHQGGSYGDISGISDAKTTVTMGSTGFSVNGTSASFSAGSDYTRGGTILLFTTRSVSTNPSRYRVSKFKTHKLKIWDSGTLVRDMVPCYRKSDGEIGLYDLVNDVFYTNQGTGVFAKGPDFKGGKISKGYMWVREPKIPAEYQEVEHIESSGTQYIDTGISAPNGFRAVFKMSAVASGSEAKTIIGTHNLNTPYGRNNINLFTIGNTWGLHMNDEMINSLGSVVLGQIYEVDSSTILGASYLDVDEVRLTTGNNTSPMSSNNLLIFANQYEIRMGQTHISAKMYSCMLYNSSYELVRDFVPCYRKSDGVIGMYDKVGGQFYTNAGTGTFTKGNDVAPTYVFKEKQFYPGAGGGGVLFEIETDFRNYSNISDVYALGWGAQAKGSMSPAVNSTYGFYCGNYTSYWGGQWLYYDISSYMANAKKIYAHLTGYMPGGYTYQANERIVLCNISRIDGNGETTASDVFATELKGGNYNSNTNIGKAVGGASYTRLVDYGSSNYTGNVDITFEIDLESGLVTSVITQPSSISMQYTLSASEISWIKSTLKFIDFAFTTYATGINNYITTAHIKIE